jgi:Zinc-binding
MLLCTVCQLEMKCTKTNTELKLHSESKHGKQLEDCFPGATKIAEELLAAVTKGKGGPADGTGKDGTVTKSERKSKEASALDDLLSAGLDVGKKKGKK